MAQELFLVRSPTNRYLVLSSREFESMDGGHQVICRTDYTTRALNNSSGERLMSLPESGMKEFLEGLVSVIEIARQVDGSLDQSESIAETKAKDETKDKIKTKTQGPAKPKVSGSAFILESRDDLTNDTVRAAIREALHIISKAMTVNIDYWVQLAADRLLQTIALQEEEEVHRIKLAARQLQTTAASLEKRFQVRLVECLHKSNQSESERLNLRLETMSVTEGEFWHQLTGTFVLSAYGSEQAKLDFNHLNRRLSYLFDRRIKPEQNVMGPRALAWCMCVALSDIGYNEEEFAVLSGVIKEFFAGSLGKVYAEINPVWIEMDILPEIKLRVRHDAYISKRK